jgi:predicted dinucleotide-binding enzyme
MTAVLLLVALTPQAPAFAARIAVIGTGDVGSALGPEFAAQGHTIVYGSRDPARQEVKDLVARTGANASATTQQEAVAGADIVLLAVPGAVAEQVTRDLGDLAARSSSTRRTASAGATTVGPCTTCPAAPTPSSSRRRRPMRVVKAFNTLNWRQMVDPETSGGPITIAIAGNDDAAKAVVAELIKGMGLEVVDFGPLRYANTLEEMLVVWANARGHGAPFNYYLRPQPQN